MNKRSSLDKLPVNFRHEKDFLIKNNLVSWKLLKSLSDFEISSFVQTNSLCTESRFKKIRAIAIFIYHLNLNLHEALLLLHCGVGTIKALSNLEPYILDQKIGRLERQLNIKIESKLNPNVFKRWIYEARKLY